MKMLNTTSEMQLPTSMVLMKCEELRTKKEIICEGKTLRLLCNSIRSLLAVRKAISSPEKNAESTSITKTISQGGVISELQIEYEDTKKKNYGAI